jgi:hypothetical protein
MANQRAAIDKLIAAKNDPTKFKQALTEAKSSGVDQNTINRLQAAADNPQQLQQALDDAKSQAE